MINTDAAVFTKNNRVGVGIIIRDHSGNFLAACRQGIGLLFSPEVAEAWAIRTAVEFVNRFGHQQVIVASDCLSVVQKLMSSAVDRSETGTITQDVKLMAAASPTSFAFIHISRWCNGVAHALAKSVEQNTESIWLDAPPDAIWTTLYNDRSY